MFFTNIDPARVEHAKTLPVFVREFGEGNVSGLPGLPGVRIDRPKEGEDGQKTFDSVPMAKITKPASGGRRRKTRGRRRTTKTRRGSRAMRR